MKKAKPSAKALRDAAKILGSLGGRTTGAKKVRGDSQYYAELVKKRWGKQNA